MTTNLSPIHDAFDPWCSCKSCDTSYWAASTVQCASDLANPRPVDENIALILFRLHEEGSA